MTSFITVNYHYVRPIKNSKFSNLKGLEVKEFINQINYLKSKYNIISATDIINTILNKDKLPKMLVSFLSTMVSRIIINMLCQNY